MFALFTIIGASLCLFGRALLKPTLFLTGVLLAAFIIIYIFYTTFLKTTTKVWIGYAVLGGSIIVGLLVGFVLAKFVKVGAFILAGWGGFAVGLLIYNALFSNIDSPFAFWGVTIGVALVFGVLTVFLFDHIFIQATAILGAFLFTYGIGLVAGHYPNPFTIVELIKNNQWKGMDPLFYAYMGGTLLLYIIGCVV
jgi:hypothetical protein